MMKRGKMDSIALANMADDAFNKLGSFGSYSGGGGGGMSDLANASAAIYASDLSVVISTYDLIVGDRHDDITLSASLPLPIRPPLPPRQ